MKSTGSKRLRANLAGERNAVFLYERLAEIESNPNLVELFKKLVKTESRHVAFWKDRLEQSSASVPPFHPSFKTRMTARSAARHGPQSVTGSMAKIEKGIASAYDSQADAESVGMPTEERSHARLFGALARTNLTPPESKAVKFEGIHHSSGNALRAGTLGANDGLLSVYSLVMGVAGAGVGKREILVTGIAGLLAGALSMALGEWISMQSSRELYERQIGIERDALADSPEEESEELVLIYRAKGLALDKAQSMAERVITGRANMARDPVAREELALDQKDLGGSAWQAAIMSFTFFSLGATLPTLPYIFFAGTSGIFASSALSILGLFSIGALTTLITGKSAVLYGFRHVLIGLLAAGITFGIGRFIGMLLNA